MLNIQVILVHGSRQQLLLLMQIKLQRIDKFEFYSHRFTSSAPAERCSSSFKFS